MTDWDSGPNGYWPFAGMVVVMLAAFTLVLVLLVGLGVITYAYERVGLDKWWLLAALVGSILGSRFDIPIARFPARTEPRDADVVVFGIRYRVPTLQDTGTITLAVNVGGALIPASLATYLVVHDHLWLHALIATASVTALVWLVARPVPGVGIVAPTLLPPIAAALVAIAIGGHAVAALAYVAGTIGTLVGADLLNLWRIRDLGPGVASIGGAGTFDGIFLTGILAVVLAAI